MRYLPAVIAYMELRAHAEMKSPGLTIVDRVGKWARDHLTVQGRADAIYVKKYQQVIENAPEGIPQDKMASLESQLRQRARSAAVGSIIVDALVGGGALIGTGVLLKKLDFRMPRLVRHRVPQPVQARVEAAVTKPSLVKTALNVSDVLAGHGECINVAKAGGVLRRAGEKVTNIQWTRLAEGIETGVRNAGDGLVRLYHWLDGALGKLADRM